MFDHKAIFLSTIAQPKLTPAIPTISHTILRDPDLDYIVGLAVADYYVCSTATLIPNGWEQTKIKIGQAKKLLRAAAPSDIFVSPGDRTELDTMLRKGNIAEIREFLDDFPYALVRDGPMLPDIDPDFCMEGLLNNIRNEVISLQNFVLKKAKENRKVITDRLTTLKENYAANSTTIASLEHSLNILIDQELRHELSKHPNFEQLNNEKITPYFIQLFKGSHSEAKIADIRNHDGNDFPSMDNLKEYITNFYAGIYRKPEDEPADIAGCIENFLGPEICRHPVVVGSKIPVDIADTLESNFSLQELDQSMSEANKSACGMDGITNCFLKKL